jgi:hypothetical protein
MAWFYSLSVECGGEPAAHACAAHFSETGVDATARESHVDNAWWAVIVPEADGDAARTAAAAQLYERLRSAPPFRFALTGEEAYEAITYAELDAEAGADPSFADRFHGLVVDDEIRERLGSPSALEPFAPGYSWFPYRGASGEAS